MMCRSTLAVMAVLVLRLVSGEAFAEPLKWNCLLREWRVSPLIPKKLGAANESLDTPLLDETAFTPEGDWENLTREWDPKDNTVCEFGYLNSDRVVYGVAVIECVAAGEGLLAIGADDGFRAYWNGQEVAGSDSVNCVFLDDHLAKVSLRQGRNVLLIKLENWAGPAGFCARLIPHQDTNRRFALYTRDDRILIAQTVAVPDLVFEFLDEAGGLVASLPCSGNRHRWAAWQKVSKRAVWPLYLPEAVPEFARVRLRRDDANGPMLGELTRQQFSEQRVALEDVMTGRYPPLKKTLQLKLPNDDPISGAFFFNAESGAPVAAEETSPGSYLLPDAPLFSVRHPFIAPGRTQGEVLLTLSGGLRAVSKGHKAEAVMLMHVMTTEEKPLAGVLGRLLVGDKSEAVAISDASGQLPFRLTAAEVNELNKAKDVKIEISAPGHAPLRLDPASAQPAEEELAAGLKRRDQNGVMLPTTRMTAVMQKVLPLRVQFINARTSHAITWEDAWVISQLSGAPSTEQHRDESGVALLTQGHGPGSTLLLVAEGFMPQAMETDETVWRSGVLEARMEPAEPLHGIVLDKVGSPLRGAAAWFPEFRGEPLPGGWERTGMDGRFTIRTHTGSPAEIAIYALGGPTFYVPMAVTSEDKPQEVRIK
jgi:hypothetical protein